MELDLNYMDDSGSKKNGLVKSCTSYGTGIDISEFFLSHIKYKITSLR